MKKLFVLLLALSLALCLGVTALAVEDWAETPAVDGSCNHEASYSVLGDNARLSAICGKCSAYLGELQLHAPTRTVYNGSGSKVASYVNNFAAEARPDDITVSYEGVDGTSYGPSSSAPEDAGSYKVTLYVIVGSQQYPLFRTYTIAKAAQNVPGAPRLYGVDANSIAIASYANSSKGNAWVEYSLDNKQTWTRGDHKGSHVILSGLEPGTEYIIWARYEETANYMASEPNASPLTVATLEGEPTYNLSIAVDDIETTYGTQAFTSLKITNSGNTTATVDSVTLSGKDAGIYEVLRWDNPSATVAPGATNETWFIRFKSADIEAGTYNCTVTVAYNNGQTATKDITAVVAKVSPDLSSQPPVIIDYAAEMIRLDSTAPAEPVWAVGASVADSVPIGEGQSLTAWLDAAGGTKIYISIAESKNYFASTWAFDEMLQRPAALSLAVNNETVDGKNDGEILLPDGVNGPVEYSADGGQTWQDILGVKLEGLSDGSYLVRLKATDSSFAGKSTEVTIAKGVPATYTLTASALDFGTLVYTPDPHEEKVLTILSGGNSDAAITSVSCTGPFEVAKTGSSTVSAGGTDTSWTIRPKAGTDASDTAYTGTVTISYNNGATATAGLYVTIEPAEQAAPAHHTLIVPWGTDWVAYEKHENANGAPIQYSFDGGQTWITGTPSPEDSNRMVISGLTPDTHYSVDFRYGPTPDGNYMASAAAELTYSVGFTTMHEVKITQGDGQTFYLGSDEELLFVSSDKFEDFSYLFVYAKGADMSLVSPLEAEHFTAEEGSVRITLKAEYLNSLPAGEYVIKIPCTSRQGEGEAIASFFVKEAPVTGNGGGSGSAGGAEIVKTGDSRQAGLWAVLVLACGGVLAVCLAVKKKKRH